MPIMQRARLGVLWISCLILAAAAPTTQQSDNKFVARGIGALSAGDVKAARDAFDDALRVEPNNMLAAHGLGVAYLKLSLPLRAIQYLQPIASGKSLNRAI